MIALLLGDVKLVKHRIESNRIASIRELAEVEVEADGDFVIIFVLDCLEGIS